MKQNPIWRGPKQNLLQLSPSGHIMILPWQPNAQSVTSECTEGIPGQQDLLNRI